MDKLFASIITIGDELLIGQVIDTNSAWMAQELNKIGIAVKNRIAVGDNWGDIWNALDETAKHAKIVLITGGLGPTSDDITKPLLCSYFGGKMVIHEPTLVHVTHIFEKILQRPMLEVNIKQAEVPDVCTVLMNEKGTAPGMLFEKNGVLFISLPGVPHEMKWIMSQEVLPLLPKKFKTTPIRHKTLLTAGIGESFLAELIKDFEAQLPPSIKLAYLPNNGMVRLRLTISGEDEALISAQIDHQFELLKQGVQEYLVIDNDLPMETVVSNLFKANGKTLATAESCTGGYIAHLLTAHAGASAFYKGSIVSYSNEVKEHLLNVPLEVLHNHGAVSELTVRYMANNCRNQLNTDYAIAVSGIMGPEGGSDDKPVGTVWIAVATSKKTITKKINLRYNRERNIQLTAFNALNLLRLSICG